MRAEYLDHMGSDLAVVDAARASFGTASSLEDGKLRAADAKLIGYLARNKHWTPFAHAVVKFRVQAPIPIRTQLFKHKIGFVENEESRRYIGTTPEVFVPEVWRAAPTGGVKQGSGGAHPYSDHWRITYSNITRQALTLYEEMISGGVAPEQARFVLPQGCMVTWIWTGSLAAYARFYKERTDPHAQAETRVIAEMIGAKMAELFPVSWAALTAKVAA